MDIEVCLNIKRPAGAIPAGRFGFKTGISNGFTL